MQQLRRKGYDKVDELAPSASEPDAKTEDYWQVRSGLQINALIDIIADDEIRFDAQRTALETQIETARRNASTLAERNTTLAEQVEATQKQNTALAEQNAALAEQIEMTQKQNAALILYTRQRRIWNRLSGLLPTSISKWIVVWRTSREVTFLRQSGRFDEVWYRKTYPDIAASGADPIVHFVTHGAREGRRPRANFDAIGYLIDHPYLALTGQNPFVHFIKNRDSSKVLQR
jgi:hypothetical protein